MSLYDLPFSLMANFVSNSGQLFLKSVCKSQGFAGKISTNIWDGKGLNIYGVLEGERPAESYYFLPQSHGIYM